jgi:predicted RNase H-like nuclease (RuvC/YqgF family)
MKTKWTTAQKKKFHSSINTIGGIQMHINALEQMVVDLIASQKLQRQLAENTMTKKESKLAKLERKLDKLELQNQEFKVENVRLKLECKNLKSMLKKIKGVDMDQSMRLIDASLLASPLKANISPTDDDDDIWIIKAGLYDK